MQKKDEKTAKAPSPLSWAQNEHGSEWDQAMDFVGDAIYLIDLNDKLVRANRTFYELTGLTPEQTIGRDITSIIHPAGEPVPCPVCRARNERRDAVITMAADHPDNPAGRPIRVMVKIIRDSDEQPLGVLMAIRDVSSDEKLRRQGQIIDQIHDGVIATDLSQQIITWNKGVEDILGYSAGETMGRDISLFLPEEVLPPYNAADIKDLEIQLPKKNGDSTHVLLQYIPLRDQSGDGIGSIYTLLDITTRIQADLAIQALVSGMVGSSGQAAFENIVKGMVQWLDADYGMISKLSANGDITPLYFLKQGKVAPNIPYPPAGTPCGAVSETGFCLFPQSVRDLFPEDLHLIELDVEGYVGIPLRNARQKVTGILCIFSSRPLNTPFRLREIMEIVASKAASEIERLDSERRLAINESRFRELFDNMKSSVAVYEVVDDGDDFVFVDFNKSAENTEKISKVDIIGKRLNDVFPVARELGFTEVFKRVWQSGKPEHFPLTFYQDNRMSGWRDNFVYKLPSNEIVAIYDDVTREKQAELDLKQSKDRLQLVLEGADMGMWDWDMTTNSVYFSPRYFSMLGYGPDELPHTLATWENILHPDDLEWAKSKVAKALMQVDAKWSIEFRLRQKDGSYRWILGRGKVVEYDVDHRPIRATGTHLDINEQKMAAGEKAKLEEQLQQAQKMESIGTLAGGIAHDFNNILTAIIGYTEIAQDSLAADSAPFADLQEVLKAGNRAKELVKQILAFSRQTSQQRQPLQIHLVVKEALKLLRSSLPATIEIRERISNQDTTVLADPTQIHQVVMNLCTNAYQAMRDAGGTLGVELARVNITSSDEKVIGLYLAPGPYLNLSISDTGSGMERAVQERIFDPYFTTKKSGEGTGLGLSVVHGIIKNHEGHITVSSEPGCGTRFNIYLPLITSAARAARLEQDDILPGGNEHIMLVDDEEPIVKMEMRMLASLGYQVTTMTSPIKALQAFSAHPEKFDLVITDMTMPQMTGAELSQKMLMRRRDVPIIICTGFSELMNEDKAKAIGIREFILKPVLRNDMAKVVREVLDGSL